MAGFKPAAAGQPLNRQQWRKLAAELRRKGVTDSASLEKAALALDAKHTKT